MPYSVGQPSVQVCSLSLAPLPATCPLPAVTAPSAVPCKTLVFLIALCLHTLFPLAEMSTPLPVCSLVELQP